MDPVQISRNMGLTGCRPECIMSSHNPRHPRPEPTMIAFYLIAVPVAVAVVVWLNQKYNR